MNEYTEYIESAASAFKTLLAEQTQRTKKMDIKCPFFLIKGFSRRFLCQNKKTPHSHDGMNEGFCLSEIYAIEFTALLKRATFLDALFL